MKERNHRVKITILATSVIIIVALIIFVLSNHFETALTKNNANPEVLYKQDNAIDFIVYRSSAYVNSSSIDWIQELRLIPDKELGIIQRTGITKKYKDFDATRLTKGTVIYTVKDRKDILLVLINNEYIPYYQYIEG